MSQRHDLDNHADQMNPNNDAYWESRGFDERPDDWEGRVNDEDEEKDEEDDYEDGQPECSGKEPAPTR